MLTASWKMMAKATVNWTGCLMTMRMENRLKMGSCSGSCSDFHLMMETLTGIDLESPKKMVMRTGKGLSLETRRGSPTKKARLMETGYCSDLLTETLMKMGLHSATLSLMDSVMEIR